MDDLSRQVKTDGYNYEVLVICLVSLRIAARDRLGKWYKPLFSRIALSKGDQYMITNAFKVRLDWHRVPWGRTHRLEGGGWREGGRGEARGGKGKAAQMIKPNQRIGMDKSRRWAFRAHLNVMAFS